MLAKTAKIVIIGAGPAGLTAGLELLRQGYTNVTLLEQEAVCGGISKTVHHDGNCIDLGGHRFFSKSDEVMQWWTQRLPIADTPAAEKASDKVFLVRHRLSRILYERKYFSYPVTLSMDTLRKLGGPRLVRIALSYFRAICRPVSPEKSLEDFFINRFGKELYATFFRDYTEKVWGLPCSRISADWGAQRVKGLSITGVLLHAIRQMAGKVLPAKGDIKQKNVETSLIEQFLYPKFGPGFLWESVAEEIRALGGTILFDTRVRGLELGQDDEGRNAVRTVLVQDREGGETVLPADVVISSMPLRDLVLAIRGEVPGEVRNVAAGLVYRDFMTVGLVLDRKGAPGMTDLKDNWIYVQEPDVHMGRIQIFNNWSPWLVRDPDTLLLGLEYFCSEDDALWSMEDKAFADMAGRELEQIGLAQKSAIRDAFVIRVPKAYPAYFGSYGQIGTVQHWLDGVANLYPVGRNGMHRYNNMDHSMLSAMRTVDCLTGRGDAAGKAAIWHVNAEKEYHESK